MFNYKSTLALGTILLLPFSANAETCSTLPSCTSLGFTKSSVSSCSGKTYLKCPFGNYYFCSDTEVTCATQTSGVSTMSYWGFTGDNSVVATRILTTDLTSSGYESIGNGWNIRSYCDYSKCTDKCTDPEPGLSANNLTIGKNVSIDVPVTAKYGLYLDGNYVYFGSPVTVGDGNYNGTLYLDYSSSSTYDTVYFYDDTTITNIQYTDSSYSGDSYSSTSYPNNIVFNISNYSTGKNITFTYDYFTVQGINTSGYASQQGPDLLLCVEGSTYSGGDITIVQGSNGWGTTLTYSEDIQGNCDIYISGSANDYAAGGVKVSDGTMCDCSSYSYY